MDKLGFLGSLRGTWVNLRATPCLEEMHDSVDPPDERGEPWRNRNKLRIYRAKVAFPVALLFAVAVNRCAPVRIFSSMTYTMVIRPVRPPDWPLIITPRVKRRHVVEVVPRPREWQRGQVSLSLSGEAHRWTRNSTCLLRSCRTARYVWPPPARLDDRRNLVDSLQA